MDYVNKVFLNFLKSEKSVPVCVWPYDSENQRWISSFESAAQDQNPSLQRQAATSNFLPSGLLVGDNRSKLI